MLKDVRMMTRAYLGPVQDIGGCMESSLLKAAVQQSVNEDEGRSVEKPEEKSDAKHPDEHVLRLLRVVQVAEHQLDLDAHGEVGDNQDDKSREEENMEEELLGVFSFRWKGCENLKIGSDQLPFSG